MKIYENEMFKIIYDESDSYVAKIIDAINSKTKNIVDFFKIDKIEDKIIIKIYYTIDEFKAYLIPYLEDHKYYDWMIGSTHDGNINNLSLECCRQIETHKDRTLEQYISGIIHEVVHKMQQIVKGDTNTNNAWFHEALATNLSNQDYNIVPIDCTLEQLKNNFNDVKNQYSISFTLGKYLLENYSQDFILKLCKDETLLDEFAPTLFELVKNREKHF